MLQEPHFACPEHIEIIIEEWINQLEVAPDIERMNETTQTPCSWCDQGAVYRLSPQAIEGDVS